ncbi:phosphotransferase [Sulfurimonas sp. SAG-AH-194-C20]|nr:phosphotransferase [Sulfurimonas sp. SAG-AH-194-C20]MDF1878621.1 phosphotransferase [Sulfurimonas sp. SAG-AH-194-C20]
MGVKRALTLSQVKTLFPSYTFSSLIPSTSGVMDTTYISDKYVIKFYERDIKEKISLDAMLLEHLSDGGLNVPQLLAHTDGWYLYDKLRGKVPKTIHLFHIQALARFMARFHAKGLHCSEDFLKSYAIKDTLLKIKRSNYRFYKELEILKDYKPKNDGFIHGDLFRDNTVFDGQTIGVFDFIDGGNGSYVFDIAVALLSFNTSKRKSYIRIFLNTYNQTAAKKISQKELLDTIKIASLFYGMLRISEQSDVKRAKELIFW